MASQIYLSGGPCDGKTVSANEIVGGLVASIKCGGGYYTADPAGKKHNGELVFDYAGKKQPGPPDAGSLNTAHTHSGWQDVRHSVNKNMPKALRQSQSNTQAALRLLGRAHKVRL